MDLISLLYGVSPTAYTLLNMVSRGFPIYPSIFFSQACLINAKLFGLLYLAPPKYTFRPKKKANPSYILDNCISNFIARI